MRGHRLNRRCVGPWRQILHRLTREAPRGKLPRDRRGSSLDKDKKFFETDSSNPPSPPNNQISSCQSETRTGLAKRLSSIVRRFVVSYRSASRVIFTSSSIFSAAGEEEESLSGERNLEISSKSSMPVSTHTAAQAGSVTRSSRVQSGPDDQTQD